ncbi:MAG: hypothetical protein KME06_11230 [Kastovskya adunca ATA6-11-RM4]|jgi:hypothetical protein|nr:hypothetical protein [Kastovskya adunca ATA6-11-RM4]
MRSIEREHEIDTRFEFVVNHWVHCFTRQEKQLQLDATLLNSNYQVPTHRSGYIAPS